MKSVKDTREILAESENGKITVHEKFSLAFCKKILNLKGNKYTDEQILLIRDYVYALATLDFIYFTEQYFPTILNQSNNEQESIPLCESEYRRAS